MFPIAYETKEDLTLDLLSITKEVPALSNWGFFVIKNGVYVFTSEVNHFQKLVKEDGELDLSLIAQIPLDKILEKPFYYKIPIIKGIVTDNSNVSDDILEHIEIICEGIKDFENWSKESIQALKVRNSQELFFTTRNELIVVSSDVFSNLETQIFQGT